MEDWAFVRFAKWADLAPAAARKFINLLTFSEKKQQQTKNRKQKNNVTIINSEKDSEICGLE